MPLLGPDQQIVGTLAVLSPNPGQFQNEHITLLEVLGRQAMTRLELYNRIHAQEHAQRARQRTERALAVERCFVAATLDSIPALVAVLDTAGRVVRFNQSCAQLTGMSLADAAGRPFVEEVLEPDDRDWAVGILRHAAAGQVSGPHETAWRVPGGITRRVSWTLRPLKGPNGEIQYVIVSGQDVTDQREAEEALLSSEARYREVVEGSLGFVFTCTMEGRLTSLNAFTAETLGYRIEDLTGRSIAELLDATGAVTFQECLHALQTKDEWQGAIPVRRSDGVYRRIAFRSRRMELHGERPFILNHGVDVTEQHEAEEALHLATRQRELILQAVGDGIYGIDLDGRLTFINEAGARALGYKPEQLSGRDIHDVIHHSHADGTPYSKITSPILQGMRRQETVRMGDEVFWCADGTSIPVEYTASPLIEDGRISGMVVAFQDISERLRLARMKDEFISTVSHELRTPLTSLRASLGFISSGALDKRPEKQKQMVDMAIANCDRLVRLVNDILDFDKVEKGRLPLRRVPVEAVDLLRRAADVAYASAGEAGIAFKIEAVPAVVIADEDRVLQVLNELVLNAIKFSPAQYADQVERPAAGRKRGLHCGGGSGAGHCAAKNSNTSSTASSRATPPTRALSAAPASASPSAAASSISTADKSGPKALLAAAASSSSPSPPLPLRSSLALLRSLYIEPLQHHARPLPARIGIIKLNMNGLPLAWHQRHVVIVIQRRRNQIARLLPYRFHAHHQCRRRRRILQLRRHMPR